MEVLPESVDKDVCRYPGSQPPLGEYARELLAVFVAPGAGIGPQQ
jgi:hypothetical protein